MNEEKFSPYSNCCGRPMRYDTTPKCNFNNCCMNEYPYAMKACIRNKTPDCMAKAVIPSTTVETVDGITNLANCFVHVTSINTTYYIDDKHRPMIIWAGPVETDMPADVQTEEDLVAFVKTFGLRSQFLYVKYRGGELDQDGIVAFYFSRTGKIYWAGDFSEVVEV